MHHLFVTLLTGHLAVAYTVLFIGMVIEGEGILFTAMYLAHRGVLDLRLSIALTLLGVLIGDFVWFWLGEHLESYPRLATHFKKVTAKFDALLLRHPYRTVFIAKFTYGFHHLALLRAGALKMSLRNFLKVNIASSLVWIATIAGLAFTVSASVQQLRHYVKYSEIGILIGIIIIIGLNRYFTWLSKEQESKN